MTPHEIAEYEAQFLRLIAPTSVDGPYATLTHLDMTFVVEAVNEDRFLCGRGLTPSRGDMQSQVTVETRAPADRNGMYVRVNHWKKRVASGTPDP